MNLEYSQNAGGIVYKRMHLYSTKKNEYKLLYLQRSALEKQSKWNEKELSKIIKEDSQIFNSVEEAENKLKKDDQTKSFGLVCKFYGIVGFFKFLEGYYLMIITEIQKIAKIGRHKLWKIQKTDVIKLFESKGKSKEEQQFKSQLSDYDMSQGFYSSYSYDLTNSLSKNMLRNSMDVVDAEFDHCKSRKLDRQFSSSKDLGDYCEVFTWNYYGISTFYSLLQNKKWVIPITHGYIEQKNLKSLNSCFSMTIIARRSRHHAGTRFSKRGINEEGFSANYVESEQILIDLDSTQRRPSCTAFIQIRGSAPVFWHQDPSILNVKPQIQINECDPFYSATKKHFGDLYARYGERIFCMDLVKSCQTQTKEEKLAEKYQQVVDQINEKIDSLNQITYFHFDMKKQLKTDKTEYVEKSYTYAYYVVQQIGIFWVQDSKRAKIEQCVEMQNGVLRSNCVDCLDRTNSFQQLVGEIALAVQLGKMFCSSLKFQELNVHEKVLSFYRGMFERMGDIISEQYGSSKAHKQNIKEQKNSKWRFELFTSIERHFKNNLSDSTRQLGIDLFLGNFIPDDNQKTYQNPNKQFLPKDGFENLVFKNNLLNNSSNANTMNSNKQTVAEKQLFPNTLTFYNPEQFNFNNINSNTHNSSHYNIYANNNNPNIIPAFQNPNNNNSSNHNFYNNNASSGHLYSPQQQQQSSQPNQNFMNTPTFNIDPQNYHHNSNHNQSSLLNQARISEDDSFSNLNSIKNMQSTNQIKKSEDGGETLLQVKTININNQTDIDQDADNKMVWWQRSILFFKEDNYVNVLRKIMESKGMFKKEQLQKLNMSLFKDYQIPLSNQRNKFNFKKFQIEFINIINKYEKSKLQQNSFSIKLLITLPKNYLFMNFRNSFQKISRKDIQEKLSREYNKMIHLFPDQEISLYFKPFDHPNSANSLRGSDAQDRLSTKKNKIDPKEPVIKPINQNFSPKTSFKLNGKKDLLNAQPSEIVEDEIEEMKLDKSKFELDPETNNKYGMDINDKGNNTNNWDEDDENPILDEYQERSHQHKSHQKNNGKEYQGENEQIANNDEDGDGGTEDLLKLDFFTTNAIQAQQEQFEHKQDSLEPMSLSQINQYGCKSTIPYYDSSSREISSPSKFRQQFSKQQQSGRSFQDNRDLSLQDRNQIDEYLSINPFFGTANNSDIYGQKKGRSTKYSERSEQQISRLNLIDEYFSEINTSQMTSKLAEGYHDYKEISKSQVANLVNNYFDYNIKLQMKQGASRGRCALCVSESAIDSSSMQREEKNSRSGQNEYIKSKGSWLKIDNEWMQQGQLMCKHYDSSKCLSLTDRDNFPNVKGTLKNTKHLNEMSQIDSDGESQNDSREGPFEEEEINEFEKVKKKNVLLLEMLVERNFIFPGNTTINVV